MAPEERERVLKNYERWKNMTPEQRAQARQRWRQTPPEARERLREQPHRTTQHGPSEGGTDRGCGEAQPQHFQHDIARPKP